jgi:hypothetical protein
VLTSWSVTALFWVICVTAQTNTVPFKTIDRGQQSGIENAREVVVRTAAEWTTVWKEHAPDRTQPTIDFTTSMVVGIFLGTRATGGHSVEIASITRDGANLVVTYRERRPSSSDIVTQVITMPYHLVSLERSPGTVRFTRAQ